MHFAAKTLDAIDQALEADQGNAYREWLGKVLPHIGDAYRKDEDGVRSHLGASLLGIDCGRALFYGYRWAKKPKFDGKTLRLFNRGHLEEGRLIALLLMIGVQVYQQDAEGKQFRISHHNGHIGGSADGFAIGIPDLPEGYKCNLEFKTHGEKSFIKLAGQPDKDEFNRTGRTRFIGGEGVKKAKYEHYVQQCLYMEKSGIGASLYVAVNKNTDHIWMELIAADPETARKFLDRGDKIIDATVPPRRIAESIGAYSCMWCDFKRICHMNEPMDKNCRTCINASPGLTEGMWECALHKTQLDKAAQIAGCQYHEQIPNK